MDPAPDPDSRDYFYWPPNAVGDKTTGGYVYFRSENGDYSNKSAGTCYPYRDTRIGTAPNFGWANAHSFQILSAGLDTKHGSGQQFPTGGDYGDDNYDNQNNFCTGTLEDEMP